MPYELVISDRKTYLYITVSGKQTLEDNITLARDCVASCSEKKYSRVLVDIRGLTGQPGVMADYELANLITLWESGKTVTHCALLEKDADLPSGKFFETAARNRGINLLVFSGQKKAEEWITT